MLKFLHLSFCGSKIYKPRIAFGHQQSLNLCFRLSSWHLQAFLYVEEHKKIRRLATRCSNCVYKNNKITFKEEASNHSVKMCPCTEIIQTFDCVSCLPIIVSNSPNPPRVQMRCNNEKSALVLHFVRAWMNRDIPVFCCASLKSKEVDSEKEMKKTCNNSTAKDQNLAGRFCTRRQADLG